MGRLMWTSNLKKIANLRARYSLRRTGSTGRPLARESAGRGWTSSRPILIVFPGGPQKNQRPGIARNPGRLFESDRRRIVGGFSRVDRPGGSRLNRRRPWGEATRNGLRFGAARWADRRFSIGARRNKGLPRSTAPLSNDLARTSIETLATSTAFAGETRMARPPRGAHRFTDEPVPAPIQHPEPNDLHFPRSRHPFRFACRAGPKAKPNPT